MQLGRRFVYHLLLHLPVDVLRERQAFWMEHAVGLPQLMHCCLGVAVMQEPTVSPHYIVKHCDRGMFAVPFDACQAVCHYVHVKLPVTVTHVIVVVTHVKLYGPV